VVVVVATQTLVSLVGEEAAMLFETSSNLQRSTSPRVEVTSSGCEQQQEPAEQKNNIAENKTKRKTKKTTTTKCQAGKEKKTVNV
tara:strand:+ start:302 stop:556 length:255 start_codon:yes stop_codon:yes gene_type:complete